MSSALTASRGWTEVHRLGPLLQHELADLADARAGQLVEERDVTWAAWPCRGARRTSGAARRAMAGAAGSAATTKATGTSSRIGSGIPTTAASSSAGVGGEDLLDLDRADVLAGHLRARRSGARRTGGVPRRRAVARSPVRNHPSRKLAAVVAGIVEVAGEQRDPRLAADHDLARPRRARPTEPSGALDVDGAAGCDEADRSTARIAPRSVSTAGIVSVIPYSWRGRQPSRPASVLVLGVGEFWANQQWARATPSTGVAAAGEDHPDRRGEEAGVRGPVAGGLGRGTRWPRTTASAPPTRRPRSPTRRCSTARWRGTAAARRAGGPRR